MLNRLRERLAGLNKRAANPAARLPETAGRGLAGAWYELGEVIWLSFPIVVGMASNTVMSFVDSLMISYVGEQQLASVGGAGSTSFVIGAFIFGTGRCTATFVSQAYGRGDLKECARYTWQGLYFGLVMQAIALAILPFAPSIFALFNHDPQVQKYEVTYFQIRLLHALGSAGFVALLSFFQGTQRPVIPMLCAIAANVVNFILDYILIFGKFGAPALGVAGTATATAVASYFQMFMLLWFFLRASERERYGTASAFRFDFARFKRLLRIGIPSGVSFMLDVASGAVFTLAIIGSIGTAALAANTAANSLLELSFMPVVGLNQGITVLVGKYIGQGKIKTAKRRLYSSLALGIVYMTTMGLIFLFFRGPLIQLFTHTSDPLIAQKVIETGKVILIFAAIFQAFDALGIVSQGGLRGAGDTSFQAVITIGSAWLIFLPLSFLLTRVVDFGVGGAWAALTVSTILTGIIFFWRFVGEKWKDIDIFHGKRQPSETQ